MADAVGKNRLLGVYWGLMLTLLLPFGLTASRVLLPTAPPDYDANPSPLGYTFSLLIFIVPLIVFAVWLKTHPNYAVEKKVYLYTVLGILIFGSLLDLCLGFSFFYFPNQTAVLGVRLPAFSWTTMSWIPAYLPIEEFGFYLFGGTYMISLYLWGILYWFKRYNPQNHANVCKNIDKIFNFNAKTLILCLILCVCGYVYKKNFGSHPEGFSGYFTFLILLACLPCMVLYDVTKALINWRAFTFMSLTLLLVSIVYEVTFGVPYGWWKYHPDEMIGLFLPAWSGLPIEAVMLWVAAAFGTVLIYEALRIFFYMDRTPRVALFGRGGIKKKPVSAADQNAQQRLHQLPDFVDDGVGLPVPRGPYVNPRVDMANYLIKVDPAKIRKVCDRYLNEVLNNEYRYLPFLSVALLSYAKIIGYALDDRQQQMGLLPENDMVIWIPTIALRYFLGIPVPTHLAMFPYRLYVDSAYGLSAGREVFGFQKTYADFSPVAAITEPDVVVKTLAFPTYQPASNGQLVPTISIKQRGEVQQGESFSDGAACWTAFLKFLLGPERCHLVLEGLGGAAKFVTEVFKPEVCAVSIKQVRDVEFPLKAALQQVIEARSKIDQFFAGGLLRGEHQIDFAELASDPFVQDLGIELVNNQQTVGLGFWVSLGFTMELGKVIG